MMMATMFSVVTMMAQNLTESMAKKSKVSCTAPASPPSSPVRRSSPPPPISDELDLFLDAFSKAKEIPEDQLTTTRKQLRE